MSQTLFTNAHVVLDGFAELQRGFSVLVSDGRIVAVSAKPIEAGGATLVDVGGRTLMPGLIDAHAHITGLSLTPKNIANPAADIAIASANYLRNCLMDGYTTIREAGGADHATARLLAEGQIIGPRLYYSGRALTQTGGGADFRTPDEETDPCGHVGPFSVMSVITDGTDAVRKAAREELRRGATQIKLFASGGVVFPAEGHATRYEFTEAEWRAARAPAADHRRQPQAHHRARPPGLWLGAQARGADRFRDRPVGTGSTEVPAARVRDAPRPRHARRHRALGDCGQC